jgi:hypothetical protein
MLSNTARYILKNTGPFLLFNSKHISCNRPKIIQSIFYAINLSRHVKLRIGCNKSAYDS